MSRITDRRVNKLIEELVPLRYRDPVALQARCVVDHEPIPQAALASARFTPLEVGTRWGSLWDSAWFTFDGIIPPSYAGHEVVALIDIGSEGCLFTDGVPCCGLTYKRGCFERNGACIECVRRGKGTCCGRCCQRSVRRHATTGMDGLASLNRPLCDIRPQKHKFAWISSSCSARIADPSEPRARKILQALDTVADLTDVASHLDEALQITAAVLAKPAHASALTAFSVGHAHLDLGWLWPYRETRRKSARTLATALRMIEEYPSYRFGISQPQQLEWLKKDYPALFGQVAAIADGSSSANLLGRMRHLMAIIDVSNFYMGFYRDELVSKSTRICGFPIAAQVMADAVVVRHSKDGGQGPNSPPYLPMGKGLVG